MNSYTYVKAIAEELRGLAVEHDVPIVSATQTTRSVVSAIVMSNSLTLLNLLVYLLLLTLCLLLSLTKRTEQSGRIMVKQLKNRYNDLTYFRRFTVGIDRAKMKLYNVDEDSTLSVLRIKKMKRRLMIYASDRQKRIDKFNSLLSNMSKSILNVIKSLYLQLLAMLLQILLTLLTVLVTLIDKVPILRDSLLLALELMLRVVSFLRSLRRWFSKENLGTRTTESTYH